MTLDMSANKSKRKRAGENDLALADGAPAAAAGQTAEEAVDVVAVVDEGYTRQKRRRGKRSTAGDESQAVDPAEAARRQRQRELRELASKLRAEGKEYQPPRKGSNKPPREQQQPGEGGGKGGEGGSKGGRQQDGDRKARHYLGDKTPGWRPFEAVEVIVLPIFWNNNKEEKQSVLAAAEKARDVLVSAGLRADMDASNKYTPGQKMKYWETMGVRVRVELGPRDVANGNCVVALAKKPGEVANKSIVNMRHKMLDSVRAALEKARTAGGGEPGREDDEESDGEEERQQTRHDKEGKKLQGKKQRQDSEEEEEEEEEGSPKGSDEEDESDVVAAVVAALKSRSDGVLTKTANLDGRQLKKQRGLAAKEPADSDEAADDATQPAAKAGRVKAAGGGVPASADALEDDFEGVVEFEAEEDKLTLSKKERMKKASKLVKSKRKAERRARQASEDPEAEQGGEGLGGWPAEGAGVGAKAAKKKAKVVTF